MTGKNMVKWAIRRYQPSIYGTIGDDGAVPLAPVGKEQVFDEWCDVVVAADTIVGENNLQMGVLPTDPVVLKHGDDVILIVMKLDF